MRAVLGAMLFIWIVPADCIKTYKIGGKQIEHISKSRPQTITFSFNKTQGGSKSVGVHAYAHKWQRTPTPRQSIHSPAFHECAAGWTGSISAAFFSSPEYVTPLMLRSSRDMSRRNYKSCFLRRCTQGLPIDLPVGGRRGRSFPFFGWARDDVMSYIGRVCVGVCSHTSEHRTFFVPSLAPSL